MIYGYDCDCEYNDDDAVPAGMRLMIKIIFDDHFNIGDWLVMMMMRCGLVAGTG